MRRDTFIVRLWSDRIGGRARGEIVHLQTKESVAFASWDQAEAFIRHFVPLLEADPDDPDSMEVGS